MQLVLARIWTRVAVSISYDDNHYTAGTSNWVTRVEASPLDAVFLFPLYNVNINT